MVDKNYDYSKAGNGLSAGRDAENGNSLWHTDDKGNYWCGHWYNRTPEQLLKECQSTIHDLITNHPELVS
jgi:hypothetical protein